MVQPFNGIICLQGVWKSVVKGKSVTLTSFLSGEHIYCTTEVMGESVAEWGGG